MFKLVMNTNRSGKACAASGAMGGGCEIPSLPEEELTELNGDVYLLSWGMMDLSFITPQEYLDGVDSLGGTGMNAGGIYALVCHADPSNPDVRIVHYLMRVYGISKPAQSSSGGRYRTMYAELMSCPGQGGTYEYIYMPLYARLPENGTSLPSSDVTFRPSYEQMYWPGAGPVYKLSWQCDLSANALLCSLQGDEPMTYDYKAIMLDATQVGYVQSSDGCFLQLSAVVGGSNYTFASRLFSLVAAMASTSGGNATQYWSGLYYSGSTHDVSIRFIPNIAGLTVVADISEPCKMISYNVFTNGGTSAG